MIVYISGPMTGLKDFNRDAFNNAAELLRRNGHTPLNPAILPDGLGYKSYLDISLAMVRASQAIYMLPKWKASTGAKIENPYAHGLSLIFIKREDLN